MSSEESSKMSQKNPSQDSSFENPRPEEEIADDIQWDIEELKDSIKRSAEEQWDNLLDSAGQHLVPGSAALIWEMEKKKARELDMELQRDYNKDVESTGSTGSD